jgi:hypothetical protein
MAKKTEKKSDISEDLMDKLDIEFNKMEKVTVAFYNPEDKGDRVNQLTITTEIPVGLTGAKRELSILAAIQKNNLMKWVEV